MWSKIVQAVLTNVVWKTLSKYVFSWLSAYLKQRKLSKKIDKKVEAAEASIAKGQDEISKDGRVSPETEDEIFKNARSIGRTDMR
jgi:hypothetical protein